MALPDQPLTLVRHSARRRSLLLGLLVTLLAVLAVISLFFGVTTVEVADVVAAVNNQVDTVAEATAAKRIPRALLAIIVGAALAVSGAAMQAVTRNPIADPGILGVTGGAALAVIIGIVVLGIDSAPAYMVAASLGALLAAAFVYAIGSIGSVGPTPVKLALAGAASSAAFVSLSSAILLPRTDLMQRFEFWRVGGLGGASWNGIATITPAILLGIVLVFWVARPLNSLALGDALAASLGEHVNRTRLIAAGGAVILAAAATATAGPIGFVGLVVPHVCRMLVGPNYRWLFPFSAVIGALLLLCSDVIGRIVARPEEVEVGIVTAIIGAPFFIWIVRRQKVPSL